jgi:uncharacterized HhH-GPD family protein
MTDTTDLTRPELLVREDPFAFLVGVLLDHGIPPERAWRGPAELRRRLGHLDPARIVADPDAVAEAVAQPPVLHRYKGTVAAWVVGAARRVQHQYGSDAAAIWADDPGRPELAARLEAFDGIGATKAQKAIDALERAGMVSAAPEG